MNGAGEDDALVCGAAPKVNGVADPVFCLLLSVPAFAAGGALNENVDDDGLGASSFFGPLKLNDDAAGAAVDDCDGSAGLLAPNENGAGELDA